MSDAFHKEVWRAKNDAHPVLNEIVVRSQTEGNKSGYERGDGKIVEMNYQQHSVVKESPSLDAEGLTPEAFFQMAEEIGEEIGGMMVENIFRTVMLATEEVGNMVDCEGKGFTFEKFLEMSSKMQTSFDASGRPHEKILTSLSPGLSQQLGAKLKEWSSDPAKLQAMDQVRDQQWKAFNEREACRRMVD